MNDNKDSNSTNPLESTADSLAMCINTFASVGLQLTSNLVILGGKAIWQVVELTSDVIGIVFRVATGNYEYENEYREGYCLEVANTKENKLLNIDKNKIEEYKTNAIDVEYMPIESLDLASIPTMCKFKEVNVAKIDNLKICLGIGGNNQKVYFDMLNSHLLICASARWGKSSLVTCMMVSFLLFHGGYKVKFLLCDYKRADIKRFEGCNGVQGKCSVNDFEFKEQIKWLYKQADERAIILEESGYMNVIEYNASNKTKIPYIIFVIDELPQVMQDKDAKEMLHMAMAKLPYAGIYFICITQDCSKETIGKMKMNVSQKIGLHVSDKTDSDMVIRGANLEEIRDRGRCKIDDGELTEFQSFFLDKNEVEAYLKGFKKGVN